MRIGYVDGLAGLKRAFWRRAALRARVFFSPLSLAMSDFRNRAFSATVSQSTVTRTVSTPMDFICVSAREAVLSSRYTSRSSSIMIDIWFGLACAAAGASSAPRTSARTIERMLGDMKLLPYGDELTRERDGLVPSRPMNTDIVAKVARRVADQPMAAV